MDMTDTIMTSMLDLKCSNTNKIIKVVDLKSDPVVLHNWGVDRSEMAAGYFEWDANFRRFDFVLNKLLSICLDISNACVPDDYDLFRTSPRLLTKEELEQHKDILYNNN